MECVCSFCTLLRAWNACQGLSSMVSVNVVQFRKGQVSCEGKCRVLSLCSVWGPFRVCFMITRTSPTVHGRRYCITNCFPGGSDRSHHYAVVISRIAQDRFPVHVFNPCLQFSSSAGHLFPTRSDQSVLRMVLGTPRPNRATEKTQVLKYANTLFLAHQRVSELYSAHFCCTERARDAYLPHEHTWFLAKSPLVYRMTMARGV